MPDLLDSQGLQVKTATDIRADLDTGFRAIYCAVTAVNSAGSATANTAAFGPIAA